MRLVVRTSNGEVMQRIDYDEYGRMTENTSPGFQPFGFADGLVDDLTGLVRFGAATTIPRRVAGRYQTPWGSMGRSRTCIPTSGQTPRTRTTPLDSAMKTPPPAGAD